MSHIGFLLAHQNWQLWRAASRIFLARVANSRLVGTDTTVVVTHSPHLSLSQSYAKIKMIKEHRHGDSCISIYRKEVKS